jgi:nucleoside-diphosphate-sugar epimerase
VPLPIAHVLAWATETFKLRLPITRNRLRYYGIKTVYPIEKAKRLLGYAPRVDLDEGMRRAEAWLREEGKI